MAKDVDRRATAHDWSAFSMLAVVDQSAGIAACREVADQVFEGPGYNRPDVYLIDDWR